ncbi:hypothetical protein B0T18DRAFT_420727 [Schizothecium vesticola]|uniref:Uncharacterized protein n=1 Tax=Schizothecium vesticola TaxID=314040 RepID=A0AA40BP65_9PEZI|nr:hypothetical protein B0T18DRAFT_420727 [Schizothecium vesticola]
MGPSSSLHNTADHPSSCSTPPKQLTRMHRQDESPLKWNLSASRRPQAITSRPSKRRHLSPCFTSRHDIHGRGSRKATIHRPNPSSAIYTARRSWFQTLRATTTADDDC